MARISTLLRRALRWLLRRAGAGAAAASRVARRAEAGLASDELIRVEQHWRLRSAMSAHDMVESPDEAYYRDRYVEWIEAGLRERDVDLSGRFLDAGCGSGRLTIPLARQVRLEGGSVVAVDFLNDSVDRARAAAAAAGLDNVDVHSGELLEWLRDRHDGEFAGALFVEVSFVLPELNATLVELRRVLRPGAPLFASLRSLHFMALSAAAARDWDRGSAILSRRSGTLPGMGWQNWHTSAEAIELLERHGFAGVRLTGVGIASGIEGDPLAMIARPSALSADELSALAELENSLSLICPDAGRYLLATATRAP